MFVKKWPSGQCTPAEAEAYLAYLEAYRGFSADVVLLDYLDIMDLTALGKETRHQLNAAYVWAKGLADDRRCVVHTVSQVTTDALERRWVRMRDVSEDRRKAGNCDLMMAIGKGPEEVKAGVAGIMVLANRAGPQGCGCVVSQCYDLGQFCMAAWVGERELASQTEALEPE